jgi:peptidoglycan/xylan/chitin deacetylase (PgdA/CDA1 family)
MIRKEKISSVLVAMVVMLLIVIAMYPYGLSFIQTVRSFSHPEESRTYLHPYTAPEDLVTEDTSKLPSAQSVPVLMYHGVLVRGPLGTNTEREVFSDQMEALKREGYETISVAEFDLFRQGKFTLPPKPIIITFDDGRKDSFYTVDAILKELGFTATMFVASVRANDGDPFYLSWDELKRVQNTGRWEIEAHGRKSHDMVAIDEAGNLGRYYAARKYTPAKGLESIEEYEERVEQDYIHGIEDLKKYLEVEPRYYAIPLGEFGVHEDNSNYPGAFAFNKKITGKYFKLAFAQAADYESFYNYKDTDPQRLLRLEVSNLSARELLERLEHLGPLPTSVSFSSTEGVSELLLNIIQPLYGLLMARDGIVLTSSEENTSTRMLVGDRGWSNYTARARLTREKGRSATMMLYYTDEDNYLEVEWGSGYLSLVERVEGNERVLTTHDPFNAPGGLSIYAYIKDSSVSVTVNSTVLAQNVHTSLVRGAVGFSIWDPDGGQATLQSLEITGLD